MTRYKRDFEARVLYLAAIKRSQRERREAKRERKMSVEREMMFFEVVYVRETEKAILVTHKTEDIWLPKSQIQWPEDAEANQSIEIQVPVWLARQAQLI